MRKVVTRSIILGLVLALTTSGLAQQPPSKPVQKQPQSEAEAKANAFLTVPLFSQVYEKYRGKLLPPTKALEREFMMLGVTAAQAEKSSSSSKARTPWICGRPIRTVEAPSSTPGRLSWQCRTPCRLPTSCWSTAGS